MLTTDERKVFENSVIPAWIAACCDTSDRMTKTQTTVLHKSLLGYMGNREVWIYPQRIDFVDAMAKYGHQQFKQYRNHPAFTTGIKLRDA